MSEGCDDKRDTYPPPPFQENVRLLRKKEPETARSSQRTTTTFCPFKICLATMEASRPSK